MKGSLWELWMFGTIAAFIAIMTFYVFTPYFEQVVSSAMDNVNFTTTSTNTSTTNTFNNMEYYWTLWPVGMLVIIMLLFFIVASDDEQRIRR